MRPGTSTPRPRATRGRSTSPPRTRPSTRAPPIRPTLRTLPSRSRPRKAARASSAGSTAARSPRAPRPRATPGSRRVSHTFEVRATDAAGNTDSTPATHTWTIDLTAPQTTIDSSPADPTMRPERASTSSSNEGGSSFECKLDGGFVRVHQPEDYHGPRPGAHLRGRATDAAGNTDASPASFTWTIDLAAPQTTITASPPIPTTTPTRASPSAPRRGRVELRVQARRRLVRRCTSPKSYTVARGRVAHVRGTRDRRCGQHRFHARRATRGRSTSPPRRRRSTRARPIRPMRPERASTSARTRAAELRVQARRRFVRFVHQPEELHGPLGRGSHTFEVGPPTPPETPMRPRPRTPGRSTSRLPTTITAPRPRIPTTTPTRASPSAPRRAGQASSASSTAVRSPSCTSPKSYTGLLAGSHTFEVRATDAGRKHRCDPPPATPGPLT